MESAQCHNLLLALISAFALFVLFGGIAFAMKGDAETIGEGEVEESFKTSSMESADNPPSVPEEAQKPSISSQSQEVDATEVKTITPVVNPGRNRIIVMSVIAFVVLAIAAAITVGVLYQQGMLTGADFTVFGDEEGKRLEYKEQESFKAEQERLEREEQERLEAEQEEARKQNEAQEMQRLTEDVTEFARSRERLRLFYIRLGVFFGISIVNLFISLLYYPLGFNRKPCDLAYFLPCLSEVIAIIVMGAEVGTAGALYCVAATVAGGNIVGLLRDKSFDQDKRQITDTWQFVLNGVIFAITLIGPIIHMGTSGSELWG